MIVSKRSRHGTTLIELLVTIIVMTVIAGMASLAIRSVGKPVTPTIAERLAQARRDAVARGAAVTIELVVKGAIASATAFPDGTVITDSALRWNRLSGRRPRALP